MHSENLQAELTTQRQELNRLYEEYSKREIIEEEPALDPRTGKPLQDVYGASQWRLIWRKFIRNKVALGGGILILLFYLVAVFGDFIAPYGKDTRFRASIYMPPTRLHVIDENGRFGLFIYEQDQEFDKNLKRVYVDNLETKIPLRFFVHGDSYK